MMSTSFPGVVDKGPSAPSPNSLERFALGREAATPGHFAHGGAMPHQATAGALRSGPKGQKAPKTPQHLIIMMPQAQPAGPPPIVGALLAAALFHHMKNKLEEHVKDAARKHVAGALALHLQAKSRK